MIQNFVAHVVALNESSFGVDRPPQLKGISTGCRCRARGTQFEDEIESLRPPLDDVEVLMDWPFNSTEQQVGTVNDKGGDYSGAPSFTIHMGHLMDQYLSGRQEKMKAISITTDGLWAISQSEELKKLLNEFRGSPRKHDKQGNFNVVFNYAGNDERGLQQLLSLEFHFP